MSAPTPPFVVVPSSTHVEFEWMRIPEVEVNFDSQAQQEAYENQDLAFANAIERAVLASAGELPPDQAIYTNSDWWPNRNRPVTISSHAFGSAVVQALAAILTEQHADWRINVTVVDQLPEANTEVGNMFFTAKQIVIERSLYSLLKNAA